MTKYIWQKKDWPGFHYNTEILLNDLGQARRLQGQLIAQAKMLGLKTSGDLLVEEAYMTSAIEGVNFDRKAIGSSVAKRLGLPNSGLALEQRHIDGLVDVVMSATSEWEKRLTNKKLFTWHGALFPLGYSNLNKIDVGVYRKGQEPMLVISGSFDTEQIHFEAPLASKVPKEMKSFLTWWHCDSLLLDGLIRAAIAHLWFVTIHPFDDGNGRLARALTDLALAQDEKTGLRLYSLSSQIMKERKDYYQILETTQKGDLNISAWLSWFLKMFVRALGTSQDRINKALMIDKFWKMHSMHGISQRQQKVVQRLLEAEPQGFVGFMTNRKYVALTRVSRETAKRDLSDLVAKGYLKQNSGEGRSVSYVLNLG